jgi:COMPASS component SWD3
MPDHPHQPQEFDAVLGGESPIPLGSVILGGIEGVKRRLASEFEEQRIAALWEALNYGEAGLDLVIGALQDESTQVEKTAYLLLRERVEPIVKQALQEYNPWRFFEFTRKLGVHSKKVTSVVAISPDGQTLVSGSWGKTIHIWHLATGKLLRTLQGHSRSVQSVAISPDGQTLVSSSLDKTIKVWGIP